MTRAKCLWALYVFACGILASLPLIFDGISLFSLVSFVPYLVFLFRDLKRTHSVFYWYRQGFLFYFGYFLGVFHWFCAMYPMEFAGDFTPLVATLVVAVSWLGLSLLQTLGFALLPLLCALFYKTRLCQRAPILIAFLFPAGVAFFEYTQQLSFAGVPWGVYAIPLVNFSWLVAPASLFGAHFVSFLCVLFSALIAYFLTDIGKWRNRRFALQKSAALLSFLTVWCAVGALLTLPVQKDTDRIKVAVLQGNISSREKWTLLWESIDVFRGLALDAAEAHPDIDVMLWPETAVPMVLNGNDYLLEQLYDIAEKTGAMQIVGAFYATEDAEYNSLFLIYPERRVEEYTYDKRNLVPFGEFVPFGRLIEVLFPPLGELMITDPVAFGSDDPRVFQTPIGNFGGLICFDSIYEKSAKDSVKNGANILMLSTNDSWFLDSVALKQHLRQAQLRAVENRRAVARCGVTGISAFIDENGQITKALQSNTRGYAVEELPTIGNRSLFSRIGNLFILFVVAFALSPLFYEGILYLKRSRERRKNRAV